MSIVLKIKEKNNEPSHGHSNRSIIAFSFGGEKGKSFMQRQAVERGYAQYCASTGEWAWKGECE